MKVRQRVVDNKKIEMTDSEFAEFEKICKASDRPNFKGEELFKDKFVTDDNGKIVYIKALGNRYVSFEAVFFLMNLMQNQHLRSMYDEVDSKLRQISEKEKELEQIIQRLKTVEQIVS